MAGFSVNLNYHSAGAMSWNEWIALMEERAKRAAELHGTLIQVHTGATMTPYDPSAGGTEPIMHYLKNGWSGTTRSMKPRWPQGVAPYIAEAQPFADHMSAVNHWVLFGPGEKVPEGISSAIWKSMADWIEENLFAMRVTPRQQYDRWRSGQGGFYGRGASDPSKINPWEKNQAEALEIKRRSQTPARRDPSKHADVYAKRGRGFLETMREIGPKVTKEG